MFEITKEQFREHARMLEVHYRKCGFFDAAVRMQRQIDYVSRLSEATLDDEVDARPWHVCSYIDRGIEPIQSIFEIDGLLGIHLLNGSLLCLTKDVQLKLWLELTRSIGMTSEDLLEAAYWKKKGEDEEKGES